jgi:hypothetical protein
MKERKSKKCEIHKIPLTKLTRWYGVKYECSQCIQKGASPNRKRDMSKCAIEGCKNIPSYDQVDTFCVPVCVDHYGYGNEKKDYRKEWRSEI